MIGLQKVDYADYAVTQFIDRQKSGELFARLNISNNCKRAGYIDYFKKVGKWYKNVNIIQV